LEFKTFAKAEAGAGVNLFGEGVESESKNLDTDHLCCQLTTLIVESSMQHTSSGTQWYFGQH